MHLRIIPIHIYTHACTQFHIYTCAYTHTQENINISVCVNGIPYINGAREMGMHERIASVT